jgi:hypothetical protein
MLKQVLSRNVRSQQARSKWTQSPAEARRPAHDPKATSRGGVRHHEWHSLAVHELATNAMKYGALRQESACLRVTWQPERNKDEPAVTLNW